MKFFSSCLLLLFCIAAHAGKVDTISMYSNSMHKYIKTVVIKPDSYQAKKKTFPVVYLLHGYDGWYSNWITRVPELKDHADTYQTLIVCPDGAIASWYFDSPVDTTYRYETYISSELVAYIDKHYRTIRDKDHRAITGLSMGGHGALFIGFRHAGTFGAAGSMSGVVDLWEVKNSYDINKRIGDTISHAKEWHDWAVVNLIEIYADTRLQIIFDCGEKDQFIKANRKLHQKMQQLKIPHEYIERPGTHNWDYWRNAVPFQLLFFQRFFNLAGHYKS